MLRRSTCTKGRADGKTFSVGIVAWWTAAIPLSAGLGVAALPPGKATFTRKYYVGPAVVRLTKVIEKFEWVAVAASTIAGDFKRSVCLPLITAWLPQARGRNCCAPQQGAE
jgi:hypothetical protein